MKNSKRFVAKIVFIFLVILACNGAARYYEATVSPQVAVNQLKNDNFYVAELQVNNGIVYAIEAVPIGMALVLFVPEIARFLKKKEEENK